jgi:DNA-binding HxlR family transcriptional regulator
VPKRYDNTIRKLSLRIKKIIKAILSRTTRIGLIVRIEDPKEAPSVDYVYIEKDTEVEETTVADIATTTHPIRSNAISIINLDTS